MDCQENGICDYLAVDTTDKKLKLLLKRGGNIFFETNERENSHSQTLLPCIAALLERAGCRLDDLGCIGVNIGPGSFTGIRIGVAAVKGLCQPRGIPAVPVNKYMLEAYNEYRDEGLKYAACFDAEIKGGAAVPIAELYPLYLQNPAAEGEFKFDLGLAGPDDYGALEKLEREYFNEPCVIESGNPLHITVTAKDRGRIAGYYCFLSAPGFAELLTVAVRREYRRAGLGRLLITDLTARAEAMGKEKIFLEVRRGNERAIRLYEKAGFKSYGSRKGYYPDGEDAICFLKEFITRKPEAERP